MHLPIHVLRLYNNCVPDRIGYYILEILCLLANICMHVYIYICVYLSSFIIVYDAFDNGF